MAYALGQRFINRRTGYRVRIMEQTTVIEQGEERARYRMSDGNAFLSGKQIKREYSEVVVKQAEKPATA